MHQPLSQDAEHREWHLEACMLMVLSPVIIQLLVMPFPTGQALRISCAEGQLI